MPFIDGDIRGVLDGVLPKAGTGDANMGPAPSRGAMNAAPPDPMCGAGGNC